VLPDAVVELVELSTVGDRRTDVPLSVIGGKGVFVKEIQAAVLDGRADCAVHSAKDLPAITPDGLTIAAISERADPRDVLVGSTLGDLAEGATVATGSARRRAQLADVRPDLRFEELRGNIDTRLGKLDTFDAIVVAAAALDRLGRTPAVVDRLATDVMLPQVGQAALAVECRTDDAALRTALAALDHGETRRCVTAERAFLERLGGDCDLPAGAFAELTEDGLRLRGMLVSPHSGALCRAELVGEDPVEIGVWVAQELTRLVELG
ncbi:MAG: hydroxymethylbilane synthase, partial [Actinobacteria bacterium]|nr:hydroxymethylbilane synthase [Actinomycetota bacterium]